jgi:protein-L-isoaspartate(D-aspartate) O-methyltransferase
MSDLTARRQFYAEELEMTANLRSRGLVDALAVIPRERFLPSGPWMVRSEVDVQAAPRQTADADPRHVYHNVAIAIDPARMLFNGAPSVLTMAIDALAPAPGERVLHLGTGLGYYTAVIAECVGPHGMVLGVEIDAALAEGSRRNLADYPWVEVRCGDGVDLGGRTFDVMLINAGITHPLAAWLDALSINGRIMMPITATMQGFGTIGKGPMILATHTGNRERMAARPAGFVAIYSAVGIRDEAANGLIGRALKKSPFAPIRSLRRDAHAEGPGCWLHTAAFCLSLESCEASSAR